MSDHIQLFVDDVTQHSLLTTKNIGAIDLTPNPTYVILELGCTKSMGARYEVNKFMRVARARGLVYEIMLSTSVFSFCQFRDYVCSSGLEMLVP